MQRRSPPKTKFDKYGPTGIWQMWGLCTSYQIDYEDPDADEFTKANVRSATPEEPVINSYDRWPNDGLLVTLSGEAAEVQMQRMPTGFLPRNMPLLPARGVLTIGMPSRAGMAQQRAARKVIQQSAEQLGVEGFPITQNNPSL